MRDKKTQETVNQRINFLIDYYESGNKSAFGRRVDMKSGVVGDLVGGRLNKPSYEALLKILAAYPSVNTDWLLKGAGQMLKSTDEAEHLQKLSSHIAPNDAHAVGFFTDMPAVEIPHATFKTWASFVELGGADVGGAGTSSLPTLLHRLPPGRTAEDYKDAIVFDIEGDSMEPTLQSGQQVIAWFISESKWEHLHNTACVVSYDDTVTVKAILDNDLFVNNRLTLRATRQGGGSFTVGRSSINSIWEVREFYGRVPYRLFQ